MARGQIEKRGDRTWRVRVYLGRDEKGTRVYRSETVKGSKKAAEKVRTRLLNEKDSGGVVTPTKETVATYMRRWLKVAAKPKLRPQTLRQYTAYVENDIIPHLGPVPLVKLGSVDIQRMYGDLMAGKRGRNAGDRQGTELSPRSVRYIHAVLRSALNQAIKWRILSHNPADAVDLPKQQRREMKTLSRAQAGKFLKEARGDRWWALWALLLGSGLRLGEALALTWDTVDLDAGVVRVRRSLTWKARKGKDGKGTPWTLQEPKTAKARRSVDVPAFVVEALKAHRVQQAKDRLQLGEEFTDHGFVFATYAGSPPRPSNLSRRSFKAILKAAELPDIRVHDLRHTCATLLLEAREHPRVVQERLGHASITLTLDLYSHSVPGMQEEAASKLEAMLG